jgi:Alginate export
MKKFLFLFLFVAAVASAFTFVVAADEDMDGKKFVIHGEVRQRADYNDNVFDLDDSTSDSFLFFPYRARIGAEGHFGKNVVGYAEFQTFGVWGDDQPNFGNVAGPVGGTNLGTPFGAENVAQNQNPDNNNDVKLYQGWIALNQIRGSKFSLKIGRQEIVKGSEMLLGDSDFYSGTAHDGAVGSFDFDSINLDVWYTRPFQRPFGVFSFPDHQSVNFYGAWVDFKKIPHDIGVSVYALYYEDGIQVVTPSRRAFWTIGGRANHDVTGKNGFAWSGELAFQTGDYNTGPGLGDTGSISASGIEGMFGYNFHTGGGTDHLFRIFVAQGSGDDDATDTDAKAFDPLFQDNHMRYGLTDAFVLSNLTAASLGWNMRSKDHKFGVDFWKYKLTEQDPVTTEDDLGSEIDAYWMYQYSPNTQIMAGVAQFSPGNELEATVGSDSAIRVIGNLRLRF